MGARRTLAALGGGRRRARLGRAGRVNDDQTARIVGLVIAAMLGLHLWRKWRKPEDALAHAPVWFGPFAGVMAGFATMVANAAGPVMTLYLLAMRLNKLEFLGTSAAFFLIINWIKVPFGLQLGLLNGPSLMLNLGAAGRGGRGAGRAVGGEAREPGGV